MHASLREILGDCKPPADWACGRSEELSTRRGSIPSLGDQSPLARPNVGLRIGYAGLAFVLLLGIPLFVRMPIWVDTYHYDLCAWNVLHGGVHYRDTFDTNPPGMVWLHIAIRSAFGWSSEAIRFADLLFLTAVVGLLVCWLKMLGKSKTILIWTAVGLYAVYFSLCEMCHCQRDTWMLLPALLAFILRHRQACQLASRTPSRFVTISGALVEGLLWATAFWIKPFVVVPGLLCWLLSAGCAIVGRPRQWTLVALDGFGVLLGGLLVGGIGVFWLWSSGTWPYFWDIVSNWLGEYGSSATASPTGYTLLSMMELVPWSAVHLIAVPMSLAAIWHVFKGRITSQKTESIPNGAKALFGCFYLGWLIQATFMQHGFIYHHVPPLLLGLTVAADWRGWRTHSVVNRVSVALFIASVVIMHPLLRWHRLASWPRCLFENSSAEMRDRLALIDPIDWRDLERVAQFLGTQDLHDGELTCFGSCTIPLYERLGVKPSTRYIEFSTFYQFFPSRKRELLAALARSPQRFLVTDTGDWWTARLSHEKAIAERPEDPNAYPPAFPSKLMKQYPWSEPVVFRAGRYFVHDVTQRAGDANVTSHSATTTR